MQVPLIKSIVPLRQTVQLIHVGISCLFHLKLLQLKKILLLTSLSFFLFPGQCPEETQKGRGAQRESWHQEEIVAVNRGEQRT